MTKQNKTTNTKKKGGSKVYKLNYKEYQAAKIYAYQVMIKHNNKEYNKTNKEQKQFVNYKTVLTKLMQLNKEEIQLRIKPIQKQYELNKAYGKETPQESTEKQEYKKLKQQQQDYYYNKKAEEATEAYQNYKYIKQEEGEI